jgi:GT2 family glycosyltransferase/glycosyltransferase involved in cell wall biosynthesis
VTERRLADLQRRNAELERRNAALEQRYRRLANRRSVRAGLALANVVGRIRRRTVVSASAPATEGSPEPRPDLARADLDTTLRMLDGAPRVTVIIPVFNAYEAVERCLASVSANTTTADEVLVIDDASTDMRVGPMLAEAARRRGIRLATNPENLGYVSTVNRAIEDTGGDVILLNADTEVGPRWVEHLRIVAYSDPTIASVTAISNNAGAFAVPDIGADNSLPWDIDLSARAVGQALGGRIVPTPTANGFCVYLKRSAIDDVGSFDSEKYPRGYGEENDWSMRARHRGWRHVVDPSTLIAHIRSASFGDERAVLSTAASERMRQDHPDYPVLTADFVASSEMSQVRGAVRRAWSARPPRRRVLSVIHDFAGGTPNSTRDLAQAMSGDVETLIFRSTGSKLMVTDVEDAVVWESRLEQPISIADRTRPDYRLAVARILVELDIELVHVRHLMKHTFDLPEVAKLLGIPVVMSVHDFYLICPTAHLIDESGRYCAGECTPGQGECPASDWVLAGPHLKHGWVDVFRRNAENLLGDVDAVVSASRSALDLHAGRFGTLGSVRTVVIPHGRDLERNAVAGRPAVPLRILLAGTIGPHKGSGIVSAVRRLDDQARIEFHIIGTDPTQCGAVDHGRYERGEFSEKVAAIRPAVLGMFSITPETWSHTVTEAWACGLPVVASDLGAPAERIRETGAGWLFDPNDVEGLYALLCSIADGTADYDAKAAAAASASWLSTAEMAGRYRELFAEVYDARRTIDRFPVSSKP